MVRNWLRTIGIRVRGTSKLEGDRPNSLPSEPVADVAAPTALEPVADIAAPAALEPVADIAAPAALEPALPAASTSKARASPRRPPEGQCWLYISAADCDLASIVRSIDGVTKVSRERGGYWCVTSSRDIAGEAAKNIVSKGGILTAITTFDTLVELHGLVAPRAT